MNKTIKAIRFINKNLKIRLIGTYVFPLLIVCLSFLNSCISHKNTILIREKQATAAFDSLTSISTVSTEYQLQPRDILSIQVSSFKPQITNFFNNERTGMFLVQENGYIYMPVLDSIRVGGLTLEQARKNLRDAIREFANDAYVSVNLLSFNITILGEVALPGVKNIPRDRITILEVVGLAGDVTEFGDRKKVKIIRKTNQGLKIALVDLTNENILTSEYFYVVPGDVVYVQPVKEKTLTFNIRQLSLVVGFAAIAGLVNILLTRVR